MNRNRPIQSGPARAPRLLVAVLAALSLVVFTAGPVAASHGTGGALRLVGSVHEPSAPTGRPADRQYKQLQGAASAAPCAVRGYIKRMESQFRGYEWAGDRADAAFAQPDVALVGAGLRESETAFVAVASSIARTAAPRCLASPHRELTTAVRRLGEAMGILAGAFEELALTGDWAAFDASNASAQELLATAGRLQQRFRAAVRREARRARVPIPAWLRD